MGGFFAAVAVGIVLAALLIPWLLAQRRREAVSDVAARHGLEFSETHPFG